MPSSTAMQPSSVHAQFTPRLSNSGWATSGRAAPKMERWKVFAATAEAANFVYPSARTVSEGNKDADGIAGRKARFRTSVR